MFYAEHPQCTSQEEERREAKRLNGVYANTAEALMQASELMLAR